MSIESKVERVAIRIAIRIHEGGELSGGQLRRTVAQRDRDVFPAALAFAIRRSWLVLDGVHVSAGVEHPPPVPSVRASGWRQAVESLLAEQ